MAKDPWIVHSMGTSIGASSWPTTDERYTKEEPTGGCKRKKGNYVTDARIFISLFVPFLFSIAGLFCYQYSSK